MKQKEVLTHAIAWVHLENTKSERNQTQKATYSMTPFI